MRVIGDFNNISDELKKLIVPLKPGEVAEYQLLTFQTLTDPDTKLVTRRYRHELLYAKDTIFDPFYRDPSAPEDAPPVGRSVNIGVPAPDGIDLKEKTVTKVETYEFNDRWSGILILDGSVVAHREMHEFLQITNRLKDSVLGDHRDRSVEAIFKLINKVKEAKAKNPLMKAKGIAISYVEKMTVAEMREFAASKNWNYKQDPEIIMEEIYAYAEKWPVEFGKEAVSEDMKRKAVIKIAMEEGTISFDPQGYRILWKNGDTLATLERKKDRNEIDAFNEWLSTAQNGTQIFNQLKKRRVAEPTT